MITKTIEVMMTVENGYDSSADDANYIDHSNWMGKKLADWMTIHQINIPGTHDSAAYNKKYKCCTGLEVQSCYSDFVVTQSLPIESQLRAGIRFLDIRLVHNYDEFRTYHGIFDLNMSLDECMKKVKAFLSKHNNEFIIMRVKNERSEASHPKINPSGGDFATSFRYIHKKYSSIIYIPNNQLRYTKVAKLRGKIIILSDDMGKHQLTINKYGYQYSDIFITQDSYDITSLGEGLPNGMYRKWELVKKHIDKAIEENINYINNQYGYVPRLNYLSGSGAFVYPFFVASGQVIKHNDSLKLLTGLTTLTHAKKMQDFPRDLCVELAGKRQCSIVYEGINNLALNYLQNFKNRKLYIGVIVMDFPSSALITQIINMNFNLTTTTTPSTP